MNLKSLAHIFKTSLIFTVVSVSFFLSSVHNSGAVVDRVRDVTVDSNGSCNVEKLKFFDLTGGDNPDTEWEIDNPVCIGFMLGSSAQFYGASVLSNSLCLNPAGTARASLTRASGVPISPEMGRDIEKNSYKCGAFIASEDYVQAGLCCGSLAASGITLGICMAELGGIYGAAVESEAHAHVCGAQWNIWQGRPAAMQSADDLEGIPDYQPGSLPDDTLYTYGKKDASYQKYLEKANQTALPPPASGCGEISGATSYSQYLTNGHNVTVSPMMLCIGNKEFREYIYGGVEYEDTGSDASTNPQSWSAQTRIQILGFSDDKQRYYMRGPGVASNYACGRFLLRKGSPQERLDAKASYESCKQRSQNTMCIEETSSTDLVHPVEHVFCTAGSRCTVPWRFVWYSVAQAKTIPNYVCAETYSVCPFNHKMGGGSEIAQYGVKDPTTGVVTDNPYKVILNHCEYLKHCAKVPDVPYIRTSDLDGGWISSACFDLKGDSQNEYDFSAPLLPLNKTKNFSAPIAQCFKETMENMFINMAGNTKCINPDEEPDDSGNCAHGTLYKEGQAIAGEQSFFQVIQDKLRDAIRMAMTIAVTIAGFMVLLSGTPWDKKTIMMFVVKFSVVTYFVLGTAWQDYFFHGVSTVSTSVADIFMRIDQNLPDNKKDGCQFPKINYAWQDGMTGTKYDNPAYPPGKDYLKVWDTLDCKIARALGFGPEVSVPNLIVMIIAGLISSFLGPIFFVATFVFAFYLISITLRALHIFIISSMAITIMIYISPITITACLFKKTEGIFKEWRKNLISFVFQPVILFAYLGIVITIFQTVLIGDAQFSGDGKGTLKTIDCSVGDAANNSLYCIFHLEDIGTNNALSPIGITLISLFNMNQDKLNTIMKAAFLMFIFTRFLDKILDLAVKLLGGALMTSKSPSTAAIAGGALGAAKAVINRGSRATKKWGGKAMSSMRGTAKDVTRTLAKSPKSAGEIAGGALSAAKNKAMSAVRGTAKSAKDKEPPALAGGSVAPGSDKEGPDDDSV